MVEKLKIVAMLTEGCFGPNTRVPKDQLKEAAEQMTGMTSCPHCSEEDQVICMLTHTDKDGNCKRCGKRKDLENPYEDVEIECVVD